MVLAPVVTVPWKGVSVAEEELLRLDPLVQVVEVLVVLFQIHLLADLLIQYCKEDLVAVVVEVVLPM